MLALLALGCTEEPPEALPPSATPPEGPRWPGSPDDMPPEASRCAADYRELGAEGLPARDPSEPFSSWYDGPFQTWTARYNALRARCDAVFEQLDPSGAAAQVVLASQSYLHERAAEDASPLDQEPQMFVLARYWSLGAACTYQSCAAGPARAWAALCERRARSLPDCPPADGAGAAEPPSAVEDR